MQQQRGCVFRVWYIPRRCKRIGECELIGLELQSSKGTAMWQEEEEE
jgi:hypothetical protein